MSENDKSTDKPSASVADATEKPKVEKPKGQPIPPHEAQIEMAQNILREAKNDPAALFFAEKMFDAAKVPERNWARKMDHWGFSMYWEARRVGLLQRTGSGKKKTHVCSFSGGQVCSHIGIPMAACLCFVRTSFLK